MDRIALIAAVLPMLVIGISGDYERPDPLHFAILIAAAAGLAGALLRKPWAGLTVLLTVLVAGAYLRTQAGVMGGSDVMKSTSEALTVLGSGGNPYAHVYTQTNPPGEPFGYPPGELAFYGLTRLVHINLFGVDVLAGIISLGLIASLAPLIGDGLAALAMMPLAGAVELIFHSADGSNDTAASFLALLGIVALAWSFDVPGRGGRALWWTSAVALGWVVAFKEYSLPIVVFVALFLWRSDAQRARGWIRAAAATVALFVLPFFAWNPGAFVSNVGGALLLHQNVWGHNLWHDVLSLEPGEVAIAPLIPVITLAAFAGTTVALWRRPAPSLGAALLQGCAILALTFVLARWTTAVYYVFLAPLVMTGIVLMLGAECAASPDTPPSY
jgi:hypothetical protein